MTLANKIEEELAQARKCAEESDASGMGDYLYFAQKYAEEIHTDISTRVAEIRKTGYENALPAELANAMHSAQLGSAGTMDTCLSLAQMYAKKLRRNISAQVTEIQHIGYKKAIPINLERARKLAEEGRADTMDNVLSLAKTYAQAIGRDVTAEATEIQKLGYQNAIPILLAEARKSAEARKTGNMNCLLGLARSYAKDLGQDISAQIAEVREIVNP